MDKKEELKNLANNPKYISGIYNYCDRWCERCPFTARCLNYEFSEKHFGDLESQDINNKEFWEKLGEVFELTFELLEDMADEMGIDLNDVGDEIEKRNYKELDKKVDNSIVTVEAKKYITMVTEWFESSEKLFEQKETQLTLEENLDLPNSSPIDDALSITDAVEVIQWYKYQIFVKLKRAIYGKYDEFEEVEDYPKDSDGSAKVALIGIDRSIAAWGKLQNHFTEKADDILDMLIHLTRLRKNVESEFPNARSFIRVGFDEQ